MGLGGFGMQCKTTPYSRMKQPEKPAKMWCKNALHWPPKSPEWPHVVHICTTFVISRENRPNVVQKCTTLHPCPFEPPDGDPHEIDSF
jgi:hypothetical protein